MALIIDSLSKKFGDNYLFRNFSYTFEEKGLYILRGESGVGKTTLLRMIAGLDNDYSGDIKNAESVSVAFQEYRLFPQLTAIENVVFANSETKSEADFNKAKEMLVKLGLDDNDMYLYPDELSGGMKQRVSLCRAFINKSPVLLLDEPTKELDSENIISVLGIIKENARRRLVIMITHNFDEVESLHPKIIFIPKV